MPRLLEHRSLNQGTRPTIHKLGSVCVEAPGVNHGVETENLSAGLGQLLLLMDVGRGLAEKDFGPAGNELASSSDLAMWHEVIGMGDNDVSKHPSTKDGLVTRAPSAINQPELDAPTTAPPRGREIQFEDPCVVGSSKRVR